MTLTDGSTTRAKSSSESVDCETSVNGVNTVFIQVISQRSGAAIGRLPVKPFLLLALKTINSFDPSFHCFVSQMYTYVGVL